VPVQIGKAGAGAREMAKKRMIRIFGCLIAFLIIGLISALSGNRLIQSNMWAVKIAGMFIFGAGIGLMVLVFKFLVISPKEEIDNPIDQPIRGAESEEEISEILQKLPKSYAVFSDLTCPMGNIDHVVVGPTGIFIIETKSHRGQVNASGAGELLRGMGSFEKDFIKQVLSQCFWLKKQLADSTGRMPFVNPLIVFTHAFVKIYKPIKGVKVLNKKWILEHITQSKYKIRQEELDKVFTNC